MKMIEVRNINSIRFKGMLHGNEHAQTEKEIFILNDLAVALTISLLLFALTPIAQAVPEWEEYPDNPVFDPAAKVYYPSVVKVSDTDYRMWFGSNSGIGYAVSADGIVWTEVQNPVSGLADANHPAVVYDNDGFGGTGYRYRIWYWTGIGNVSSIDAIRYAESKDGTVWEHDQVIKQHPTDQSLRIITGYGVYDNYFYHLYGPSSVIYSPDATNTGSSTPDDKTDDSPMTYSYIMYYDTSSEGFSPEKSFEQLALAYSTDGIYWTRYGDEPVLIPSGNPADWDGKYSYRGSVLEDGGTYRMWYSGADGTGSDYYAQGIGCASSPDGLTWTKSSDNPVMHRDDGNPWRSNRTYTPVVLMDGCGYEMWFTGKNATGNYAIGYAAVECAVPPVEVPAMMPYGFVLVMFSLFGLVVFATREVNKR